MNLKIETYLYLDEDEFNPEEVSRLAVVFSDFIVEVGYGNEAAPSVEDTQLKSVLIVKPTTGKLWEKSADGKVMAISFPTDDEDFVKQADSGGIKEIG